MSEFLELAKQLASDIVDEVKASMGDDYARLTDLHKATIHSTGVRVMDLRLRLNVASDPAVKSELKLKLQAVESSVTDWKVWGEIGADIAFWKGVQVVAETLGSFLAGVGKGLVPGL